MNVIQDPDVAVVLLKYPLEIREKILKIRKVVLKVAKEDQRIGDLVETLKWGEPSYLPKKKKVGTTVRLAWSKKKPDYFGLYVHCQTKLIPQFKSLFGKQFSYDKDRGILFHKDDALPLKDLEFVILKALTYHLK